MLHPLGFSSLNGSTIVDSNPEIILSFENSFSKRKKTGNERLLLRKSREN